MTDAIIVEGLAEAVRFGRRPRRRRLLACRPAPCSGCSVPNGAGKTTVGAHPHDDPAARLAGRAEVLGIDVTRDPQAVRERIGLAGQYAAVDENLTGHENLRMVGRLTHLSKPVVLARGPASCSNGSTSPTPPTVRCAPTRAACAAGSTSRPRSCTARRCSSSTSRPPVSTRAVAKTCGASSRTSSREGTTLLLTTQYLEEADRLADNIVVIDHGRVIARGHVVGAQGDARRDDRRGRASPIRATAQRAQAELRPHRAVRCRCRRRHWSSSRSTTARESCSTSCARSTGAHLEPVTLDRARADARRRVPVAHRPQGRGARAEDEPAEAGRRRTRGAA